MEEACEEMNDLLLDDRVLSVRLAWEGPPARGAPTQIATMCRHLPLHCSTQIRLLRCTQKCLYKVAK